MKFSLRSLTAAMMLATATTSVHAEDLLEIYQQALTNDPVVLQAQAQRNSLYEAIEESRSTLLPQISASVGYNKSFIDADSGALSSKISLSQNVYDHSAWVALDLAELAASQADASYASTLQTLIIRVSSAYFAVLSAQDALTFQKAEVEAIGRQLEQTKQRFAVGLSAITDVHEAQAQYDLARAQEIQAENTVQNSYQALQEITGLDYKEISVLDTERFATSTPTPDNSAAWLETAERSSITLLIQRIAKDIANEQIDLAKSGHMPTADLSASVANSSLESGSAKTNDVDNTGSIGLTVSMPIFTGYRVDSLVKQAQFNYVSASESLEQSHRSVSKDVRSNFNNVIAAISSIKAYEQTVISSESALKATEVGFEVGTRTIVDVLASTRNLYSSKRQLSDARYTYIQSILALKQAAGTLNEDDIIAINQGLTAPAANPL